jgi:hypothetical protein
MKRSLPFLRVELGVLFFLLVLAIGAQAQLESSAPQP